MVWMWLGCSMGFNGSNEDPQQTEPPPSEAEVEDYITNDPIDLADGSSVNGAGILTETSDVSWYQLSEVPEGFADDVDNDALADTTCPDGAWLAYEAATSSWGCAVSLPAEGVGTDGGTEGQVLVIENGTAQWVDLDTLLPEEPCPSGMAQAGDTCIETSRRSALNYRDALLDCAADGYHLCRFREWNVACELGVASFPAAPDNSKEQFQASEDPIVSGTRDQGCWAGGYSQWVYEHPYRCCVSP